MLPVQNAGVITRVRGVRGMKKILFRPITPLTRKLYEIGSQLNPTGLHGSPTEVRYRTDHALSMTLSDLESQDSGDPKFLNEHMLVLFVIAIKFGMVSN